VTEVDVEASEVVVGEAAVVVEAVVVVAVASHPGVVGVVSHPGVVEVEEEEVEEVG